MTAPAWSKPSYTYRAEVVRVIDGDTIDVKIDVGFDCHIYKRLRFLGVDTWETRGEEREKGLVAKAYTQAFLETADKIYIQTEMDAKGKYGRVLSWVWKDTANGPICLNERLLAEGHGQVPSY